MSADGIDLLWSRELRQQYVCNDAIHYLCIAGQLLAAAFGRVAESYLLMQAAAHILGHLRGLASLLGCSILSKLLEQGEDIPLCPCHEFAPVKRRNHQLGSEVCLLQHFAQCMDACDR